MTKIIVEPRKSGKTTKAIIESAKSGKPILVAYSGMAKAVESTAKGLGLSMPEDLPKPLTLKDIKRRRDMQGTDPLEDELDGVIVDEALIVLRELLGLQIDMVTMSDTNQEPNEEPNKLIEETVVDKQKLLKHLQELLLNSNRIDEKIALSHALIALDKELFTEVKSRDRWSMT